MCYIFVAYASYPGVGATSGPGTYREVCPGAVILYFQQLSFVWAGGDYTNYSPYRTEAIVNPTQWIFVLEKQRGGSVDFPYPIKPIIDITKVKFRLAKNTQSYFLTPEVATHLTKVEIGWKTSSVEVD